MNYEIQSRQDPLEGAALAVTIPEEELDHKAFYTLRQDMPPFLIPFRYRAIDGMAELSYPLGGYSRLRYFYGDKTPSGYIQLWENLLQPLLECKDWFLDPLSFLLDEEYLYQNKDGVICYLYIPSRKPCSSYEQLKGMVFQLAKKNHINDPKIENVVLSMLMQDFRPESFLEELRKVQSPVQPSPGERPAPTASAPSARREEQDIRLPFRETAPQPPVGFPSAPASAPVPAPAKDGEIIINLSGGETKKKSGMFSLFGRKGDGAEKKAEKKAAKKEKKMKPGKEKKSEERMAAAQMPQIPQMPPMPQAQPAPFQPAAPGYIPPHAAGQPAPASDETQLEEYETCLRLVGAVGLPPMIPVNIQVGEVFTIGRFDITVGRQQSSFEFREDTRAVSRHHAAIERDMEGYTITDIASRAGTFVDGMPLKPNVPYRLRRNTRVSFGNGGADYLWEE